MSNLTLYPNKILWPIFYTSFILSRFSATQSSFANLPEMPSLVVIATVLLPLGLCISCSLPGMFFPWTALTDCSFTSFGSLLKQLVIRGILCFYLSLLEIITKWHTYLRVCLSLLDYKLNARNLLSIFF